jgi:hypothetical protein
MTNQKSKTNKDHRLVRHPDNSFQDLSLKIKIKTPFHEIELQFPDTVNDYIKDIGNIFFSILFCGGKIDGRAVNRIRVARWFIFKPKSPIWVNVQGP